MILKPSQDWLKDVSIMYRLFDQHHPMCLRQGPGLIQNFLKVLKERFPHRAENVLREFAIIRTNNRIKFLNVLTREGKKTLRGARNLAETINS